MRVAYLNVTDSSGQCPIGFRIETATNVSFCIRDTSSAGCGSVLFETRGITYTQVCGYARGYSYNSPDSFATPAGMVSNEPLGACYVDGISITYGTPPTHIWSFAAGPVESGSSGHVCPCNVQPGISAPLYVGNDYYCESGTLTNAQSIWYTSDPLWDGMQCGGEEGPCCNRTGLPWFNKNLSTPTTATITTRVCLDEATTNENIGIDRLELYVK